MHNTFVAETSRGFILGTRKVDYRTQLTPTDKAITRQYMTYFRLHGIINLTWAPAMQIP